MKRLIGTVIAIGFLSGCGSPGPESIDSGPSFAERQIQEIEDAKKNDDFEEAYEASRDLFDLNTEDKYIQSAITTLRSFSQHKQKLRSYLQSWLSTINSVDPGAQRVRGPQTSGGFSTGLHGYNEFLKTTENFEKAGYATNIHSQMKKQARNTLRERVATADFKSSDNASYSHIPADLVKQIKSNRKQYRQRQKSKRRKDMLHQLQNPERSLTYNIGQYIQEAEEMGEASSFAKALRRRLPGLTVSWNTLDDLESLYPEYVSQIREVLRTNILVEPEGQKGDIVAFDLVESMKDDFESANISDLIEDPDYTVTVNAVRWSSRQLPERQRTVRYAQHQVQLLGSTLMMPDNSSYVYNVNEGGAEMRYAVRVTVRDGGGKVVSREMFRDTEKETYQYCSEARIVNAFGGSEPASFVANEHMKRTCQDSSANVDVSDLEKDALSRIESGLKNLEPFSNLGEEVTLPELSG